MLQLNHNRGSERQRLSTRLNMGTAATQTVLFSLHVDLLLAACLSGNYSSGWWEGATTIKTRPTAHPAPDLATWQDLITQHEDQEQVQLDYGYMTRAAAEAANLPEVNLSEEDFRALRSLNTNFAQNIEIDYDSEE
jgi:hypothetical protein